MSGQTLNNLPFISETQIEAVLTWQPLMDVLENAMIDFSAGRVAQPVRQFVQVPGQDNAMMAAMPAAGEAMAVKVFTLYPQNSGTAVPTLQGVILVFDKNNGTPLAVLDGRLITEMRTAAGSAAAARKLAKTNDAIVTIMGNGVQAHSHAKALAKIADFKAFRLWSRNEARGQALADKIGARYYADAEQAVRGADIIACTTAAKEPILDGAWLKEGAFVTSVGWNTVDGRELNDAAMANTVIVESRAAAKDQAGNIRGSGCEIFAEIGEIYAGTKIVPDGNTIIYDSVGMAIMDAVAAKLAYDLVIK
ncbi:thiomorpholine-carboxylate dehydrogenase [Nitrosomonas sp. Nm51]|uniref:ornithine cyclodeaminase family protein n=1 Tax=Nitrosomonas sp. Nm51 TaxID=133720 RepID=UPI0008BC5121|nr:ornithine cyclodeaminase family protein [Nitrosomonas sp. Nm51]SEQ90563.1 thiomorpholine-carboxylate dehydrogenase [Nitrosomonas sp. Nm51]